MILATIEFPQRGRLQLKDACWTGGPSNQFATDGLTPYQPLPDSRFPVISGVDR